jgi:outer membrane protein OmpA-like peptidoglycan-associated protein
VPQPPTPDPPATPDPVPGGTPSTPGGTPSQPATTGGSGGTTGTGTTTDTGGTGDGGTVATTPGQKVVDAVVSAATKIIGVLATTAGFLAFVAATGAAVTWVRLRAAKLPADRALEVVSQDQLIGAGQVALGIFVLLGLLAVIGVYAADPAGRRNDDMRTGLAVLVTAEVLVAVVMVPADETKKWIAAGVVALAGLLGVLGSRMPPERDLEPGASETGFGRWRRRWGGWIATREKLEPTTKQLEDAKRRQELGVGDGKVPADYRRRLTGVATFAAAACGGLIAFILWRLFADHWWVAASVIAATALAGICFGVARASGDHFWPYGLAVFFSVIVFGAALEIARLWKDPQVEPAALIRQGNTGVAGVVGLYIASDDDRYWLGAVTVKCEDGVPKKIRAGSGRIFSIPRSQVLDDVIGSPGSAVDRNSFGTAGDRALDLLAELVRRQPPGGAPPPAPTPTASPTATPTGTAAPTTIGASPAATPAPAGDTSQAAPQGQSAPPEDLVADDAALVPRALAVTGECMKLPPRVIRLEPPVASPGDTVRIIGTDLGTATGTVTLNDQDLESADWTGQSATFEVPREDARSGRIRVRRRLSAEDQALGKKERDSNSLVLTVKPNAPPVASVTVRPVAPNSRTFVLDASGSVDPEGRRLSYRWRADLGRITDEAARVTRFRLPAGEPLARIALRVTDDQGQRSPASRTRVKRKVVSVVLADGTFVFGKSDLTRAGRRSMARLSRQLVRRRGSIRRIAIDGFADFAGTLEFNQTLSEQRAQAVRSALHEALRSKRIRYVVRGHGETAAVAQTFSDPRRANDRRVEVEATLAR